MTTGGAQETRRPPRLWQATIVVAAVLVFLPGAIQGGARAAEREKFDHLETGFPLTGPHRLVQCETCHQHAIFAGTPTTCGGCHVPGRVAVSVKPAHHVPSGNRCDDCHTEYAWAPARFEHGAVTAPCIACHNSVVAAGKAADHIPAPNACETCHGTRRWTPTTFTHDLVTLPCVGCHNGIAATGKHAAHIPAGNTCDDCHGTRRWKPSRFTHALTALPRVACHNNRNVSGKQPDHIPAPDTCEICHNTVRWKPVGTAP
jgi:hypothetical protein